MVWESACVNWFEFESCSVLRQIFQCIVPIIDVLVLLFFMISLFALIGKDI
jgi:hypothetical protein